MKSNRITALLGGIITAGLLTLSAASVAATQHVIVESGDSSLSKEAARQNKELWDSTHGLRSKLIQRDENTVNKLDVRDRCNASTNVNAYWEGTTERCLDRRTGRTIMAP